MRCGPHGRKITVVEDPEEDDFQKITGCKNCQDAVIAASKQQQEDEKTWKKNHQKRKKRIFSTR